MCWLSWLNGGVPEASAPRVGVDPQPPPLAWLNGGVPEASAPRVGGGPSTSAIQYFFAFKATKSLFPFACFYNLYCCLVLFQSKVFYCFCIYVLYGL